MSETLLDQTILNILEQRLSRERVAKVVNAQLSHGGQLLRELGTLEQALDRARIKAIAHQMAGSSGSIGLVALGEAAGGLETAVADLSDAEATAAVHALIELMRASFARLLEVYPESAP